MVSLYIKTSKYQNISSSLVSEFKERVISDGGTFEAGLCCLDIINNLGGAYDYADTFNRIELFEDEKISVTSSIQNINDISKVFTDYSQSFTIPASDTNNEIFKHWYENAIDNGFDQRIRYDGFIKIDTQTFRVGKWQLEGASVKDNRIENYKITFYGDLKSLTDKFGDDKLKDVETLNDYTLLYTGENVKNKVTASTAQDVMFPLISSERVWQYGDASANDISISGGAINYTELFPAIKVARIFDAIASKYVVNFSGDFLTRQKFQKAYLWLKNSDSKEFLPYTESQLIEMADTSQAYYNIVNNEIDVFAFGDFQFYTNFYYQLIIDFSTSVDSVLTVYKNGQLYTTINQTNDQTSFIIDESIGVGVYRFEIQTNVAATYTYNYSTYIYEYDPIGASGYQTIQDVDGSGSLVSNIDFTKITPDIKVSDFFSGMLKMFNLTAFSTDGINFTLEQLEEWYYQGEIRDYSQYCITDFEYNRIKPYKKINFEYEKSENLLSRNFYTNNSREYGNLSASFNNDGSDYTIKLPFENLLFNKFTGTNLQVGYALKSDLTTYAPKPIILYLTERNFDDLYFNDGTTTTNIGAFAIFGQDTLDTADFSINTLNWGVEISSYTLNVINNSLFNNYYLAYLSNLYSLKSRMVKVKMRLPYSELLKLKLNDRIVIRNKRYVINQYTTDLTTFESDFELIQDFRSINYSNGTSRIMPSTASTYTFYTISKEPLTWTIASDDDSVIFDITNYSDRVDIKTNDNVSGLPKVASVISNLNDIIIINQDA